MTGDDDARDVLVEASLAWHTVVPVDEDDASTRMRPNAEAADVALAALSAAGLVVLSRHLVDDLAAAMEDGMSWPQFYAAKAVVEAVGPTKEKP